ncbi:MAG: type II toxin-antitoxin system RelE/ParE family toxin [Candidatus Vogelbacteria bacterium]|nr:type II toxin-antitoxin system RelE/ParE family toxin [Candidatus Vogelbacteria bacterium]
MEVKLHRKFLKNFKKLTKKIRVRFVERKNLFINEPFHPLLNNHSVDRVFPGCRSINVTGDYRAIFRQENDRVVFLLIGTHGEL